MKQINCTATLGARPGHVVINRDIKSVAGIVYTPTIISCR